MRFLKSGLVLLGVVAFTAQVAYGAPGTLRKRVSPKPVLYSAHQMEAYLSSEEVGYIRPGLNVKLNSLTNVAPGQKPVVDVTFTDDLDQPLDYAGKSTPGAISIGFILAVWDANARQYTSLTLRTRNGVTNPSADQGGKWNHVSPGHSIYTFGTTMPANFDVTKTYTLGVYARRTLTDIIGKNYYAENINYDFRPNGQSPGATFDAMDVQATCNRCHDPLAFHGGTRRTVKMCVMCHQPQIVADSATGNSFDFKVMIHKIHMGENLPSVEAGGSYVLADADFSTLAYPQDIRNCTTCHQASKPEGHIWYSRPNRKSCGSCHDNVNWETGVGHVAGPQLSDQYCSLCHLPEGETEFDLSIIGAHTIPTKSEQLGGLHLEVMDVSNTAPGQKPTVMFKITDDAGMFVAPSSLNSFRILLAGPTTDYDTYFRETATGAACSGDTCTYTFTAPIPETATGTWTLSADYYKFVMIDDHTDTGLRVRDAGFNPIYDFIVTDAQPMARRAVVSTDKCNVCHDVLALHGGQRYRVEECNICHNPTATGESVEGQPDEGIHLKWMVHRLHTGEELGYDFSIGGHNYNEVLYPGDRRNCEKCHLPNTYTLPLAKGLLPTQTPRDFMPEWRPAAAACLSCHDSIDAAAHAYVNNAPFGEACASCHGDERDHAVEKVHAR